MDKNDLIKNVNEFKKEPIKSQINKLVENSDGHNYQALNRYNAILDNITFGCNTKKVINYAGIDWSFRPLSSEEFINIRLDIAKIQKEKECWDDWYNNYLIILKTLSIALSPNPFKIGKDDKGNDLPNSNILTENDLKLIPTDILYELYKQYLHFINMAIVNPLDFTDEEVNLLLDLIKKKSIHLTELDRPRLLKVAYYYMNYAQHLEKMLESEKTN